MSIETELEELAENLQAAKSAVVSKGGSVEDTGFSGLASEIESVPTGGQDVPITIEKYLYNGNDPTSLDNAELYDIRLSFQNYDGAYNPASLLDGTEFSITTTIENETLNLTFPAATGGISYGGVGENGNPVYTLVSVLAMGDASQAIVGDSAYTLTLRRSSSSTRAISGKVYLIPISPVSSAVRALSDIQYVRNYDQSCDVRLSKYDIINVEDVFYGDSGKYDGSSSAVSLFFSGSVAKMNAIHYVFFPGCINYAGAANNTPYLVVFVEDGYTLSQLESELPNGFACFAVTNGSNGSYRYDGGSAVKAACDNWVNAIVAKDPSTVSMTVTMPSLLTNPNDTSMSAICYAQKILNTEDFLHNFRAMTMFYEDMEDPEASGEYTVLIGTEDQNLDLTKIQMLEARAM